jgi:hypothetical protein
MNKERIKAIKGLGKNYIHDRYNSPPTKAPTDNTCPWSSLCLDILRPYHLVLHGLIMSFGNFPLLMDAGPIGYLVFLQLCIVDQCNIFELLEDMLGFYACI